MDDVVSKVEKNKIERFYSTNINWKYIR
jgi:hypothetical protein